MLATEGTATHQQRCSCPSARPETSHWICYHIFFTLKNIFHDTKISLPLWRENMRKFNLFHWWICNALYRTRKKVLRLLWCTSTNIYPIQCVQWWFLARGMVIQWASIWNIKNKWNWMHLYEIRTVFLTI